MDVFRRLVFTALIAGLISGGLVTIAHHFGTASVIARAEVYEKAADEAEAAQAARAMPGMDHAASAAEWEPEDGAERTLYTALADVLTAIGFCLLLAAALELRGEEAGWRRGLFWGLAGFAVFVLAPGLGLPPEVPGTASAPLADRQIWWACTASATAAGLFLVFLQRRPLGVLAGVVVIVAPHLLGAPRPAEFKAAAPEALAREFAVAATVTSFVFWLLMGSLSGALHARLKRPAAEPRPAGGTKRSTDPRPSRKRPVWD